MDDKDPFKIRDTRWREELIFKKLPKFLKQVLLEGFFHRKFLSTLLVLLLLTQI